MKKIISYYILIGLFSPLWLFSQELKNGSFEEKDFLATDNRPNRRAQIAKCADWKEDESFNGNFHTPDWLKSCEDHIFVEETVNGVGSAIAAQSGCGYAGMTKAELIQQQVGEFEPETKYTLSFFIRLIEGSGNFVNDGSVGTTTSLSTSTVFTWTNPTPVLNVMISNKKIKYENNVPGCDFNSADKVSDSSRDIFELSTEPINLSLANFPSGSWHKIEFDFQVPPNQFIYDYIAFEIDQCNGYLLIDNIVLEEIPCETCTTCSPYDGCIEYEDNGSYHTGFHYSDATLDAQPWTIFNGLSNVEEMILTIGTIDGTIIRQIVINQPGDTFEWDGRTESGSEAAAGAYFYTLVLTNDCQSRSISGQFNKFGTAPSINFEEYDECYVLPDDATPACCQECLILTSEGIGCSGDIVFSGTEEFVATDKIEIGDNVQFAFGSNITFKAQEINISSNCDILAGGSITVDCISGVEGCTNFAPNNPSNALIQEIDGNIVLKNEEEEPENTPISEDKEEEILLKEIDIVEEEGTNTSNENIVIYPNPNTGKFNLLLPLLEDNSAYNISIFSQSGIEIERHQLNGGSNTALDLTRYPAGLYFLKIKSKKLTSVKKIILH